MAVFSDNKKIKKKKKVKKKKVKKQNMTDKRKKILFVVDVQGWAYDDRAKNWKRSLAEEYNIDIMYLADHPPNSLSDFGKVVVARLERAYLIEGSKTIVNDIIGNMTINKSLYRASNKSLFNHTKYDGIMFFYNKAIFDSRLSGTKVPKKKTAICINNEKWRYEKGMKEFLDNYANCKIVIGCNNYIIDELNKYHTNVAYASQLVNDEVFFPKKRKPFDKDNIVLGFSGKKGNPWKNFKMIEEACKGAGVELKVTSNRSRSELNDWHSDVDGIICASTAEGGPMCLLEAGACKTPVISTVVGLGRQFLSKNTAITIKNNKKSIIDGILFLKNHYVKATKNAENLYKIIKKDFTYKSKSSDIANALARLCEGDND